MAIVKYLDSGQRLFYFVDQWRRIWDASEDF